MARSARAIAGLFVGWCLVTRDSINRTGAVKGVVLITRATDGDVQVDTLEVRNTQDKDVQLRLVLGAAEAVRVQLQRAIAHASSTTSAHTPISVWWSLLLREPHRLHTAWSASSCAPQHLMRLVFHFMHRQPHSPMPCLHWTASWCHVSFGAVPRYCDGALKIVLAIWHPLPLVTDFVRGCDVGGG